MTETNPIIPPPELLQQWATECWGNPGEPIGEGKKYIAIQAARWGADMELEACVEWLAQKCGRWELSSALRAARRPKSPSLAEQGCDALDTYIYGNPNHKDKERTYNTIRRALNKLKELEKDN